MKNNKSKYSGLPHALLLVTAMSLSAGASADGHCVAAVDGNAEALEVMAAHYRDSPSGIRLHPVIADLATEQGCREAVSEQDTEPYRTISAQVPITAELCPQPPEERRPA